MSTNYLYGMRLRGFSPGCQPKDGLICCEPGPLRIGRYGKAKQYHDGLWYSRKLSDKELRDYELDFIREEEE